ncbi:DUF4433 domain-containing protein [Plantibacter sp. Mn2098]|uniref:DUF4433 domain-containing protein n=1 Tax=Plantibacter sp. Mn2098 TaxID=3395266 RepID=UPI003BE91C26
MSDECIHGFEDGLCASCFPKPVPEVVAPAPAAAPKRRTRLAPSSLREPVSTAGATSLRTTTTSTTTTTAPRVQPATRPAGGSKQPPFNAGQQRLYHVTHIRNLEGILADGAIFADESMGWSGDPAVDITAEQYREDRRKTELAGVPDGTVSQFVPFALTPHALLWERIRSGEPDYRLSGDALASAINDFVVLVTTVDAVSSAVDASDAAERSIIVTDGDAARVLTRIAANKVSAHRMVQRLVNDEDQTALIEGEVLVPDNVPFERILVIGVGTVNVRETVKRMVAAAGHKTKVAAYTPWFQPGAEG